MKRLTIAVAALSVIGAMALGLASHFITVDHYFGTYGVSIGTNNSYVSIEDKLPVITYEHAA